MSMPDCELYAWVYAVIVPFMQFDELRDHVCASDRQKVRKTGDKLKFA
jgi:hypothetical protein